MAWDYDKSIQEYALKMGDKEARLTIGDITVLQYTTPTGNSMRKEQVHYTAETGDLEKAVLFKGRLNEKQPVSSVYGVKEQLLQTPGLSRQALGRLQIMLEESDQI